MAESAGLVLFRFAKGGLEILIGHPGGPLWAHRDAGAWSIPKGLVEEGEDLVEAARRELEEETGFRPPSGELIPLGTITQRSGKRVTAWAIAGDVDPDLLASNPVVMKWPPRTETSITFPEIDRAIWAAPGLAAEKLNPAQVPFVERLEAALNQAKSPKTVLDHKE